MTRWLESGGPDVLPLRWHPLTYEWEQPHRDTDLDPTTSLPEFFRVVTEFFLSCGFRF